MRLSLHHSDKVSNRVAREHRMPFGPELQQPSHIGYWILDEVNQGSAEPWAASPSSNVGRSMALHFQ
jgi:hypothetical protein